MVRNQTACFIALLLCVNAAVAQEGDFTARYRLTFEADWSAVTHPMNFPPNPHFSGMIGGTHDDLGYLWRMGEIASAGVERMAETGAKGTLRNEVFDLIDAGVAGTVVESTGITTSPGMVSTEFDILQTHPLVSVTSMIAPSPDWFVGVDALNLRLDGQWREQVTIELQALDAGTDSGPGYTSADQETSPREPIAMLTSGPWSDGTPLGRLVFELVSVEGHFPISGRHSGIYFNPQRDGEGLNIAVDTIGDRQVITVIWYTYSDGQQMFLIGSADYADGDDEVTMNLVVTRGTGFGDEFDPEEVETLPWGTLTVRFPSCQDVTINYDGGAAGSGSLSMQRALGVQGLTCD